MVQDRHTAPGWSSTSSRRPRARPALGAPILLAAVLLMGAAACDPPGPPPGPAADDASLLADVEARLADRFTPGLHTFMMELQHRHASLWFAGNAENWRLADYYLHELGELIGDIEQTHPEYEGIPVADLLGEITLPAVGSVQGAVDGGDRDAFTRAYDDLTGACNACHTASDRSVLVIQRPSSPPLTNLRFTPG